jgi:hypothetical protein
VDSMCITCLWGSELNPYKEIKTKQTNKPRKKKRASVSNW